LLVPCRIADRVLSLGWTEVVALMAAYLIAGAGDSGTSDP